MEPVKKFIKFAISVDGVIFGFDETDLKVLLIERGEEPYVGEWALPGDLVYPNEDTDTAAQRVLEELTGLKDVFLEHLGAFGKVGRHPLGRVITLAYYALIQIWRACHLITTRFYKNRSIDSSKMYASDRLVLSYCLQNSRSQSFKTSTKLSWRQT